MSPEPRPEDDDLQAAIARHRQGDLTVAVAVYERVLAREPDHPLALHHLGLARFQRGERQEGLACLVRATERGPEDAAAWSDRGRMHAILGDLQAAVICLRRAVAAAPDYADGWHNLGTALRQAGNAEAALEAYRRALAIDPSRADTYLNLGNLLIDDNQSDNAVEALRRAALLDPKLGAARAALAAQLSGRGEVSEAEYVYRQAIALNPGHAQAWFGLGRTLEDLGEAEEAERCYRRVLALRPLQPWALGQLLSLAGARVDESLLRAARHALADEAIPDGAKALIGYGLGKALDRRGDHDAAFAVFHAANAARRRQAGPFDAAEFERRIQHIIDTFTQVFFDERRHFGVATELPVLIVGMPRSGTTLTEQIVDRHPQMSGAGELPHLAELAASLRARFDLQTPWPLCARELRADNLAKVAEDYLHKLRARSQGGAVRISDKSPLNFHHLGLVALLFPKARIVHCRRNPIDTCLSIWFENFRPNQNYATDLADIALYYRGYERLMAHWRRVLPLRMHEARYEDTVARLEGSARALVDFLHLPWSDRCLDFHASERVVQTPSRWQVRQPIYRSSVGRWRHYRRHLGVLEQAFPRAR
jgi:tetratricopeptide (TPR) repeat protein